MKKERDYEQEYKVRGNRERERKTPYATDSTKGKSMINPVNYKGDVLVQVWMDSRVLATICRWMDNNGEYALHMSQAVRKPLEILADTLVSGGDVEMVDDTGEARYMLERRFNVDLNRGGRGGKNVLHNINLSEKRGELADRVSRSKKFDDVARPRKEYSPIAQQAIETYNKLFSDNQIGKVERPYEYDASTSIRDVVSKERIVTHEKMTEEETAAKIAELDNDWEAQRVQMDNLLMSNCVSRKDESGE